jgi:hypothetical protein
LLSDAALQKEQEDLSLWYEWTIAAILSLR